MTNISVSSNRSSNSNRFNVFRWWNDGASITVIRKRWEEIRKSIQQPTWLPNWAIRNITNGKQ